MRVLVVGGNGTIGRAVADVLAGSHEVLRASRSDPDLPVDARDEGSVRSLFERVGRVDAIVAVFGEMHFGPFAEAAPAHFRTGLDSKLMGQINLALIGQHHLEDEGSVTLTSGILGDEPIRFGANACSINLAVEGFVRGAAVDLKRGMRINAVSPGVLQESWDTVGSFVPGFETVPASRVAKAYLRSVEGAQTGQVLRVR